MILFCFCLSRVIPLRMLTVAFFLLTCYSANVPMYVYCNCIHVYTTRSGRMIENVFSISIRTDYCCNTHLSSGIVKISLCRIILQGWQGFREILSARRPIPGKDGLFRESTRVPFYRLSKVRGRINWTKILVIGMFGCWSKTACN